MIFSKKALKSQVNTYSFQHWTFDFVTYIFAIVVKGNSHHLIKVNSKRRRSKKQIAEDRLKAALKEQQITNAETKFQ